MRLGDSFDERERKRRKLDEKEGVDAINKETLQKSFER